MGTKGLYRKTFVEEGMALLEERCPNWLEMVAGKRLHMQFGDGCVLGCTFVTFHCGRKMLGLTSNKECEKYGFTIVDTKGPYVQILGDDAIPDGTDPRWNRLGRTWEKMIAERVSAWPRR